MTPGGRNAARLRPPARILTEFGRPVARGPPPAYNAANRPAQRGEGEVYQGPGGHLGGHFQASGEGKGAERKRVADADESVKRELAKQIQVMDRNNRQEIEQVLPGAAVRAARPCLRRARRPDRARARGQYADYYALIRTMEKLEEGYIRGTFRDKEYEVPPPRPTGPRMGAHSARAYAWFWCRTFGGVTRALSKD
jgi:hypothetical protein